jgi:ribosomal protein S18 acetylase RimI-like enzyme
MMIQRFCRAWKEHGTAGLIKHLFRNKFPIHICLVYRKTESSNSCTMPGLLIERFPSRSVVGLEVIESLRMAKGDGMIREVDKLFSKGCELWVGLMDGQIAGICWSRSHERGRDHFVPLEETDAVILSCFVFPAFRGRGVYPAMLEAMVNTLMNQDQVRKVYIDCKSWNVPSIRGIKKAGFVFIGKAARIVLCEHVWILWNQCK